MEIPLPESTGPRNTSPILLIVYPSLKISCMPRYICCMISSEVQPIIDVSL